MMNFDGCQSLTLLVGFTACLLFRDWSLADEIEGITHKRERGRDKYAKVR